MKVALCLSGHVRTYLKCKQSLFDCIIHKYNPDIFIHTWNDIGYGLNGRPKNFINNETKKIININFVYGDSSLEFIRNCGIVNEDMFQDLKCKKIKIEDYSKVEKYILNISKKIYNKNSYDYPPNFISAQRKIYLCNELVKKYEKENNFKYDIIIKSRFDIKYDLINIKNEINNIYIPIAESYGIFSDIFAYGDNELMNKYQRFFIHLNEYNKKKLCFNPHTILKEHCNIHSIPFVIDPEIKLNLYR